MGYAGKGITLLQEVAFLQGITTAQRDGISSPRVGMLIYNSTKNKLNVYTGAEWEAVTSA